MCFMYMCVYLCEFLCITYVHAGACGGQKMALDPRNCCNGQLWASVCVLGTKPGFSKRTANSLILWAISPVPFVLLKTSKHEQREIWGFFFPLNQYFLSLPPNTGLSGGNRKQFSASAQRWPLCPSPELWSQNSDLALAAQSTGQRFKV